MGLIKKICHSIKENIEKEMQTSKQPITNLTIRKIAENTITFFVWKNKNKRPLVKATVFDESIDK